jgi:hypothetical protein
MKVHSCKYCSYQSDRLYNLKVHQRNKHGNHLKSAQPAAASNPHPYIHPYLNNASQQPYPQRTPEMVANNTYYAKETRAPTKISVGPNGPRAPTTISVPPQIGGVQEGSGIGDQFHRPLQNIFGGARQDANNRAPTTYREPGPVVRAPTTISIPPVGERVQHGDGIQIDDEDDMDDEDMDTDSDSGDEYEEDKDPDVYDVLVDIISTFHYLQDLRKQYRDLLPQLKEMKKDEMDSFLEVYSLLKTIIIEEQDGLEGSVSKKQYGKGVTESEGETDEETVDDGDDADTEDGDTDDGDDTEEETVDSEEEETEDEQAEDVDVKFDDIEEDESNKEPFFNFVFEAENFMDVKSKETLENYLARDKKNLKLADGCDQDETDLPQNVSEVIEDIEHVFTMWNEKEEECFKQCSKRKVHSVCNVAHMLMDGTSLQKMKKINPSKYRFIKRMLKPHKKSFEKLVDANVSIHEKRKTLQKPQVGEGILQTATHLMIPLLNQILKR